jgi:heme A synthase
METLSTLHRGTGEALFVIYLLAMIVAIVYSRRESKPPAWIYAIAHGLLGVQVLMGIILIAFDGLDGVPWYHPVLGLVTLAALGLAPALQSRFLPGIDSAVLFGIVAILALVTQFSVRLA